MPALFFNCKIQRWLQGFRNHVWNQRSNIRKIGQFLIDRTDARQKSGDEYLYRHPQLTYHLSVSFSKA